MLIGTGLLAESPPKRRLHATSGLAPHARYTIGDSPKADAPAPSEVLGTTTLPLVTRWGGGFLVSITPRMTGDVAAGGKVCQLADYLAGWGSNFTGHRV